MNHEKTCFVWKVVECIHGPEILNRDRPGVEILASAHLLPHGSQLRHPSPVIPDYRTGSPRTISRAQRLYSAHDGVRRRFTSLSGALYSDRLAQESMLRRPR